MLWMIEKYKLFGPEEALLLQVDVGDRFWIMGILHSVASGTFMSGWIDSRSWAWASYQHNFEFT